MDAAKQSNEVSEATLERVFNNLGDIIRNLHDYESMYPSCNNAALIMCKPTQKDSDDSD